MEIKLLQYLFGLKTLVEFHSAFFQSNNCFMVRRILTLLYLEDTEASQFRGQATMMPFWASCLLYFRKLNREQSFSYKKKQQKNSQMYKQQLPPMYKTFT